MTFVRAYRLIPYR